MSTSRSGGEFRIEYSAGELQAISNGFVVVYGAIALGLIVVAVVVDPTLLFGAAFFAGFLVWWYRRITARPLEPWTLTVTADRMTLRSTTRDVDVVRADAESVSVRHVVGTRTNTWGLRVKGRGGQRLLDEGIPAGDVPALKAALDDFGWPVGRKASA